MTLGDRIKETRKTRGLSQSELAKLTGVSQQSIQKLEAGKNTHTRYLKILAKALKCNPAWLQFGSSYINPEADIFLKAIDALTKEIRELRASINLIEKL